MRETLPKQERGHRVEVEEAAVVGDEHEALRRIERWQTVDPVHLAQVAERRVDPRLTDVPLPRAEDAIEGPLAQAAPNETDLRLFERREQLGSCLEQIRDFFLLMIRHLFLGPWGKPPARGTSRAGQ